MSASFAGAFWLIAKALESRNYSDELKGITERDFMTFMNCASPRPYAKAVMTYLIMRFI